MRVAPGFCCYGSFPALILLDPLYLIMLVALTCRLVFLAEWAPSRARSRAHVGLHCSGYLSPREWETERGNRQIMGAKMVDGATQCDKEKDGTTRLGRRSLYYGMTKVQSVWGTWLYEECIRKRAQYSMRMQDHPGRGASDVSHVVRKKVRSWATLHIFLVGLGYIINRGPALSCIVLYSFTRLSNC